MVNVVTGARRHHRPRPHQSPEDRHGVADRSIDTGEKVLQAASATIKRAHLELGGKAPVIVFDDADPGSVVAGVKAFGYYNAGQDFTAACRIYAGKKI